MSKVKRVIMPNQEVTKKALLNFTTYLVTDMPNFNLLFRYYKYVYDERLKKHKLIINVVSIRKEDSIYLVSATASKDKSFTNKNKMIDYMYDEIIKKEWFNIPQEVRDEIREKLLGWK